MTGAPPINYSDEMLYEHLSLIVNEFEKAALRSGSRRGILVTAQSPLQGMDMVLASSDKALTMGRTASASRVSVKETESPASSARTGGSTGSEEEEPWSSTHNNLEGIGEASIDEDTKQPSFNVGTTGSFGFDADFNELLGGEGDPDKVGDTIGDYLRDCLGCNLQVSFDWQMQPIDLLGPVADLLADINAALDKFDNFIDPFGYLQDLCELLNGLNLLCIPHLISILMSLKMLLKSYLTFQLGLTVDWTLLLGPILKLILDAIATLLQQVAGIIVAPLDCAIGALTTLSKLQEELTTTAALAGAVANRVANRAQAATGGEAAVVTTGLGSLDTHLDDFESSIDSRFKDIDTQSNLVEGPNGNTALNATIESLKTSTRAGSEGPAEGTQSSFVQGFQFDAKTTLPAAMKTPGFLQANPFAKLAVSVQEARNYIMDLVRNVLLSLESLQGLTSGSLSLSVGNLGLMLFVKDMINLVLLLIKMLSQNTGVGDWCSYLEENPAILERELNGMRVVPGEESLALVIGAEIVGEIKTCFNERSGNQKALLDQWISDLDRKGSS